MEDSVHLHWSGVLEKEGFHSVALVKDLVL